MTNVESHQFQTETRQLLDLMIHSLYSNKEIFLRELISNASDAIDRLRFESITNPEILEGGAELEIRLDTDSDARTLTISDNGIGMSREELIRNIGTIARSGTRELIDRFKEGKDGDLPPEFIGQFGIGFYSSFMVAERIMLVTRRAGEQTATSWESAGDGNYTIRDAIRKDRGTSITLHLKPEDREDGIDDFTSEFVLGRIVKQYSDFVAFPIKLRVRREEQSKDKSGDQGQSGGETTVVEDRTLNSMKAIWTLPQAEVAAVEYNEFYRHITHDWNEPLRVVSQHAEGTLSYHALLFIPSRAPSEFYYQAHPTGLQLYLRKVKVMEQCSNLLPRHLRFVRGVVDCTDLPLNVSRETLQDTREIGRIRRALSKKVMDTLAEMRDDEPDSYRSLWSEFGRALKEGVVEADQREKTSKLLLFRSSHDLEGLTSLTEYVGRMKDDQSEIYYVTGESTVILDHLPQLEAFKEKGYEVLYLTDPVDELMVQHLTEFEGKKLQSVGKGVIDLGDEREREEAKKEREEKEKEYSSVLELIQKTLDEHVKQVRLSSRLASSPACLVGAEHDYSPRLEELLLKGKGGGSKSRRILEINPRHPILGLMKKKYDANEVDPVLAECAELLYGQALLAEGLDLPDPVKFSRQVVDLMVRNMES